MNEYSFEVQNDDVLKRIDLFLTDNMGVLSRNNIQKLIKDKKVFVNNKNVKHSYKLQKNDFIQVFIDEPGVDMATLAHPLGENELESLNSVKVVLNKNNEEFYKNIVDLCLKKS